jgi:UPF0042 nucleotide-binding protein
MTMTASGNDRVTEQSDEHQRSEILILTGLSGAGRSTVANALEDMGWYVIDNLPPKMLVPLAHFVQDGEHEIDRLAVVLDVRGGTLFSDLDAQLDALHGLAVPVRVVYLEASDAELVRRFEKVRRPHPLQNGAPLVDAIRRERQLLATLRGRADTIIDTTGMNVHQLTNRSYELFGGSQADRVTVTVTSFGFKHGIPLDADMVADMRFLPNPFWVEELRSHTGQDADVRDYVLGQPGAQRFLADYEHVLTTVLGGYLRENKRHAMFAFGCTGGKHRSVAMANEMARRLRRNPDLNVEVTHRDLGKE